MVRHIGRYEITGKLGDGGFGSVYRGFDPSVERVVAIKVLANPGDASILNRFRAEAMTAGNLNHNNIVTIYEFGEDGGVPFLAMEYLDGVDLRYVINQEANGKPLTLLEKLEIMADAAKGLQCAHEHGVVHRDVKPANIMCLKDGGVKIMDFGISRLTNAIATRLTQTGSMIGTVPYMAPEQFRSGEVDALCDVWSYGVVLYELLTGTHPFKAAEPAAAMFRITMDEPVPLTTLVPNCPPSLPEILQRLLTKDRVKRTQSLDDFLLDAEPIIRSLAHAEVPVLVKQAAEFVEANEIERAQAVIGRIFKLDRSNQEARRLRDYVRERVRVQAMRPNIEALLREADEHASQRNYPAALDKLNSAILLDPGSPTLRSRIERLRGEEQRAKAASELITRGRMALSEGDLTGAFTLLSEAIEADPGNTQVTDLLEEVKRAMHDREVEAHISAVMTEANNLILIQSYDDAITLLEDLLDSHAGHEQIVRRLVEARQLKAAQDDRERLNAGMNAARELLKHNKHAQALAALQDLDRENPNNPAIEILIGHVQERIRAEKTAQDVETLLAQARENRAEGRFDQALQLIQQALLFDRSNGKALGLQRTYLDEAQADRDQRRIDAELNRFTQLLRDEKLEEALSLVDQLAADHPRETRVTEARQEIIARIRKKEEGRKKQIQKGIQEAERLLAGGQAENATQLLGSLTVQFPTEGAINHLLNRARQLKVDQELQGKLNDGLNSGRNLLEKGEFEQACRQLEELARQFPNTLAVDVLLRHSRDQLRAKNTAESVDAFLAMAEEHGRAKRYDEALQAVQSALDLEPANLKAAGVRKIVTDEQAASRDQRKIEAAVGKIQKLLRAQEFEQALGIAETCSSEFPLDARIAEVRRDIIARILQRDELRDHEVKSATDGIEQLLAVDRVADAIAAIEDLRARYPNLPALPGLLDRARLLKRTQDAKDLFNAALNAAKDLLDNHRFEEALGALEELKRANPGNPAVEILLSHARDQSTAERLNRDIAKLLADADNQRSAGRIELALHLVQRALDLDKTHKNALQLQKALSDDLSREVERKRMTAGLEELHRFLRAEKLEDALAKAQELAGESPKNPEIRAANDHVGGLIRERDEARARELRDRERAEQAEIDASLVAIDKSIAKKDWIKAVEVADEAQKKRPASAAFAEAVQRIQRLKQQDEEISAAEAAVAAGHFESAIPMAEAALAKFPADARAIKALQSARNLRALNDLVLYARRRVNNGDLEEARRLIREGRVRFPEAPEWNDIEVEVQEASRFEQAAREARKALNERRFEDARNIADNLATQRPEDAAIRNLLTEIGNRRAEHERQQTYDGGRDYAERQARALNFQAATDKIRDLLKLFPGDAALQQDLERITAAQREHVRKENYTRGRAQAQKLSDQGQLDEAMAILVELLREFPEDPRLLGDLQANEAVLKLRDERIRMDALIGELDALFRKGDAVAVRKGAKELLARNKEPRAGELLEWAERSIAQARDIRRKSHARNPLLIWGALAGLLLIAAGTIYLRSDQKPQDLKVEPAEVPFSYRKGSAVPPPSQPFRIEAGKSNEHWTIKSSDAWLRFSRLEGAGSMTVDAAVEPSSLPVGEYTAVATVNSDGGLKTFKVHLKVAEAEAPRPKQSTVAAAEISVSPGEMPFAYERKGRAPGIKRFRISTTPGDLRWSTSVAEQWINIPTRSGAGGSDVNLTVNPESLPAGDYTGTVRIASTAGMQFVTVHLHVTDPPVVASPQPPPTPLAPPVNCYDPAWPGSPHETVKWEGTLPPGGTLKISNDRIPSIGKITSGKLPGCPVSITELTSGITLEQEPAEANNFHEIRLRNDSAAPIYKIQFSRDRK